MPQVPRFKRHLASDQMSLILIVFEIVQTKEIDFYYPAGKYQFRARNFTRNPLSTYIVQKQKTKNKTKIYIFATVYNMRFETLFAHCQCPHSNLTSHHKETQPVIGLIIKYWMLNFYSIVSLISLSLMLDR